MALAKFDLNYLSETVLGQEICNERCVYGAYKRNIVGIVHCDITKPFGRLNVAEQLWFMIPNPIVNSVLKHYSVKQVAMCLLRDAAHSHRTWEINKAINKGIGFPNQIDNLWSSRRRQT